MFTKPTVAVIGGGPAGLMAAETLARGGAAVAVYDRMANPGRKFLLAGRGGLNLTHSEPLTAFLPHYGAAAEHLRPALEALPPDGLRAWCHELGETTFVGTSGRVFPKSLKASPLLRAWLGRLSELGVRFERGMQWTGWNSGGELTFVARDGDHQSVHADAVVLALGGASWPKLGSDGGWVQLLAQRDVQITPLTAANCGVTVAWSEIFRSRFAGVPLKRIALSVGGTSVRGEAMVTAGGLEGGVIYELGPAIRAQLAEYSSCSITLDLRPDFSHDELATRLARPRGKQSLSNHLRKVAGLPPVAIALLREAHALSAPQRATPHPVLLPTGEGQDEGLMRSSRFDATDPAALACLIKAVPLTITGLAAIERAISTAGGIAWSELDAQLMLRRLPGVFAAGEMLDWEAPTGGYLLQASFSTGHAAARGVLDYVVSATSPR